MTGMAPLLSLSFVSRSPCPACLSAALPLASSLRRPAPGRRRLHLVAGGGGFRIARARPEKVYPRNRSFTMPLAAGLEAGRGRTGTSHSCATSCAESAGRVKGRAVFAMEEAGLQLPDFEESDFYVEQEQVNLQQQAHLRTGITWANSVV